MKPLTSAIAFIMLLSTTQTLQAKNIHPEDNNPVTGEITVTHVHNKAVRDFSRLYRHITNVKWYITGKGYSASFDEQGKNIKVVYDANGMRLYSIISYTEKGLDSTIRDEVKSKYYDHQIIGVHQFEFENGKTIYVVKMLDGNSTATTLKVYNGQLEEIR